MISITNLCVQGLTSRLSAVSFQTVRSNAGSIVVSNGERKFRTSSFHQKDVPEIPKRPLNHYTLFAKDILAEILKNNPNLKSPESFKIVGQRYKNITPEEKELYLKMASECKEKYVHEMKAFSSTPEGKDALDKKVKAKQAKRIAKAKKELKLFLRELGCPKQSLNQSSLFVTGEKFPKNMKSTDIFKDRIEKWKNLSEPEKEPFIKKAAELRSNYIRQKEEWNRSLKKEDQERIEELRKDIKKYQDLLNGKAEKAKAVILRKKMAVVKKKVKAVLKKKAVSKKKAVVKKKAAEKSN